MGLVELLHVPVELFSGPPQRASVAGIGGKRESGGGGGSRAQWGASKAVTEYIVCVLRGTFFPGHTEDSPIVAFKAREERTYVGSWTSTPGRQAGGRCLKA